MLAGDHAVADRRGAWLVERSDIPVSPAAWAIAAAALGGVLFAGSLAERGLHRPSRASFAGALVRAARVRRRAGVPRWRRRSGCPRAARASAARSLSLIGDVGALAVAALAVLVAPVVVPRARVLRCGCCSSAAAAPDRSTKACASCTVPDDDQARPGRRRRAEAGDARAGGRGGARAAVRARSCGAARYYPDCVSVFPSVTPAAAASITTGTLPDEHGVPSICWYHRGEGRYVDYGSSGAAVRTFGVLRTITDTVYNMNFDHLSRRTPTVFERLDDAGRAHGLHAVPDLSAAARGTSWALQGWMRRVAQAANFRHAVYGPSELFYGELYASQDVDCQADARAARHARPVLRLRRRVRRALRPLRLPALLAAGQRPLLPPARARRRRSRRSRAPTATCSSSPMRPAASSGSSSDHAVILMSDHAQIAVSRAHRPRGRALRLAGAAAQRPRPRRRRARGRARARARRWCTCSTEDGARRAPARAGAAPAARGRGRRPAGVDGGRRGMPVDRSRRAAVRARRRALTDRRGMTLGRGRAASTRSSSRSTTGVIASRAYPDALRRLWAALHCPGAGDVLVSAAARVRVRGLGRQRPRRRRQPRLAAARRLARPARVRELRPRPRRRVGATLAAQWSITDVAGVVLDHFGVAAERVRCGASASSRGRVQGVFFRDTVRRRRARRRRRRAGSATAPTARSRRSSRVTADAVERLVDVLPRRAAAARRRRRRVLRGGARRACSGFERAVSARCIG